jgi:CubicO group peptidase (beta-lactamase class C family)
MRQPTTILKSLCLVASLALLTPQVTDAEQASSKHVNQASIEARITRIEHGLLPAAIIRGQPIPAMTLADRMKYYCVPGVSIAFLDHSKIAWARGYGLAEVATKKAVTPETLFQAASTSKSVAALAALRLVQRGTLDLDQDVNRKLIAWKVPDNQFTQNQKVTLRRLLSHTAGLTVGGFAGYLSGESLPTPAQVLNGQKPANNEAVRVDREPGKQFLYSGGGYVVVQQLLMDVTGKPFPELVHDLVFKPLGMNQSTFEQPLPTSLWSNAARPYAGNGEPVQGGWRINPEMAPAGLWTTPSDLARFSIEIAKAYAGQSKLISSALAHEMLAYQSEQIYGFGVALGQRGHAVRFWHSGANSGYKCLFETYPELGQGLVIMTNGDGGLRLIGEIQRAVAQEYDWPDGRAEQHTLAATINPAALGAYTGVYLFSGLFQFTITQQNGKLYVQYPPFGDAPQELLAESETRFFMTSQPVVLTSKKKRTDRSIRPRRRMGRNCWREKRFRQSRDDHSGHGNRCRTTGKLARRSHRLLPRNIRHGGAKLSCFLRLLQRVIFLHQVRPGHA